MWTLLCDGLSADAPAPAIGTDWAVTLIVLICAVILEDAYLFILPLAVTHITCVTCYYVLCMYVFQQM
jgi:hypothetical protein